jgi:uncharacterized protein YprB with RNaseH-like and TPR domain
VSISPDHILEEQQIICACWKWEGDAKVYSAVWDKNRSDKRLVFNLKTLIDSADLVVAHNGDRFDLGFIKGRLLFHDFKPLRAPNTDDTYKLSKRAFYLNAHRLGYLGRYLKLGGKVSVAFPLWVRVWKGEAQALKEMVKYCKKDVVLCQQLYKRILPHVKSPVNKALLRKKVGLSCPSCAHSGMTKHGWWVSRGSAKQRWTCHSCGWDGVVPGYKAPKS